MTKLLINYLNAISVEKRLLKFLRHHIPVICFTWLFKWNFEYDMTFLREIKYQSRKWRKRCRKWDYERQRVISFLASFSLRVIAKITAKMMSKLGTPQSRTQQENKASAAKFFEDLILNYMYRFYHHGQQLMYRRKLKKQELNMWNRQKMEETISFRKMNWCFSPLLLLVENDGHHWPH